MDMGSEQSWMRDAIRQIHIDTLANKVPFILTENLFEAWGRAQFASGALRDVRSL